MLVKLDPFPNTLTLCGEKKSYECKKSPSCICHSEIIITWLQKSHHRYSFFRFSLDSTVFAPMLLLTAPPRWSCCPWSQEEASELFLGRSLGLKRVEITGGWTNPSEKYATVQLGSSFQPSGDKHKPYLKPPPRFALRILELKNIVHYITMKF